MKAKRLRRRLLQPLLVTFFLLWLGTVWMLIDSTGNEAEALVSRKSVDAQNVLEEQWEWYLKNLENGLGPRAANILRCNLSPNLILNDGVLAYLVRDSAGTVIRSQLAWGYGHEDGIDRGERWYLSFDEGLDDQGQMEFARWLIAHREGWDYTVYPPDSFHDHKVRPDGTFARVTGLEQPGYGLSVQKIELVHPDGTTETMVETTTQGDNPITLDLKFMRVGSILLPSASSSGNDGYTNMERRLANFRTAQEKLTRKLNGESSSIWSGVIERDGITMRYIAGEYQTLPYVLRTNWPIYLFLLLLTALAAFLLSSALSEKVTKPTETLCRQAEQGRCAVDGPVVELNTLAAAFNLAQDRMEAQLQRERDFTRAAAHELKTPLAVLRTHAEALREDIAPEKRDQYLDILLEESDRMAALTASLLELSRLESGIPLKTEWLDLSALIREVFGRLSLQMEQKSLHLKLELAEIWLDADRSRLIEGVGNLASNALRHCTDGGTIGVTLTQEDDLAHLTVTNDGQPIPPEDLPHLFEPFYRGDRSRSRESGGTGLGLAILRATALAHGGDCAVENLPNGPAFHLTLPIES